jgi:hypothetical protein
MKFAPSWLALALLACACVSQAPEHAEEHPAARSNPAHPTQERLDAIAAELREMGRVDQEARKSWIEADNTSRGSSEAEALRKRVIEVDEANTARLRAFVDEIGWPRRSVVGAEAAASAWLIAQHSGDDAFQSHALELLRPLLDEGEVSKSNFALLDDRVHCHRGEPQTYGTQYKKKVVEGVVHFGPVTPIVDPDHLDERRASMGLEPQASYIVALRRMYHIPDDAVIDG